MNDERGVDYGSLFLCLPKGFVFVSGGAAGAVSAAKTTESAGGRKSECPLCSLAAAVFLTCAGRCDNIAAVGCAPLRVATLAHFSIYRKKERK